LVSGRISMRVFTSARTTSVCMLVLAAALFGVGQAAAQQPSQEQIAAVKSNCRSDFMAKSWGVPRGGTEAFQCLKKNLASLSAPCRQAVKAEIAFATPTAAPSATSTPAAGACGWSQACDYIDRSCGRTFGDATGAIFARNFDGYAIDAIRATGFSILRAGQLGPGRSGNGRAAC
jgi:hypothetical protein